MSTATRVTQLLLAWAMLSIVILSVGCKKNESRPPEAVVAPPAPRPAATPAAQVTPPAPAKPTNEIDVESGRSSQEEVAPANRPPPAEVTYDPTGLNPTQIFERSALLGPPLRGALSDVRDIGGAPLHYSSSSPDSLRETILSIVNQNPDPAQKAADLQFAGTVGFTTFHLKSRTASIDLVLRRDGQDARLTFEGQLDGQSLMRAGDLATAPHIAIEAMCMDLDGSCATVHVKVQDGSGGQTKTAHVIARKTEATLFTEANGYGVAHNLEYDRLLEIFLNTAQRPDAEKRVRALVVQTSETINGSSMLKLRMRMSTSERTQQTLEWLAPLVRPVSTSDMNLLMRPLQSRATIDGRPASLRTPIAQSIKDMRLVRNDGRGNFQFELTVRRNAEGSSEDTFRLTVARINTPVRALTLR